MGIRRRKNSARRIDYWRSWNRHWNRSRKSSQEPTLSCFTIREDFADDEEDDPSTQITEEEMQQARQEIQEIRQLLAGVSSEVIDQQAMAEEEAGGSQSAASKGSSPDMEEYEVIPASASPAEPAAAAAGEIHLEQDAQMTSTTAESEENVTSS